MTEPSVAYFILARDHETFTELCAYPNGKITIRKTRFGANVCEIFLCDFDEECVENIQSKLDQLAEFIKETKDAQHAGSDRVDRSENLLP